MKVYEYEAGKPIPGGRVIALGFFDGVHEGHRALLGAARELAEKKGESFAVFTFPSESEGLKVGGSRLYTTGEKLSLIEEVGADEVILADFPSVMNLSAEAFVCSSLAEDMNCTAAVFGADFRFGAGAAGDAELLRHLMQKLGRECLTVEEVRLYGRKISSSAIKEYLKGGETERANAMLGSPYFIEAEITHGLGLGNKMGFPTVNTDLGGKEDILRCGVYRALAKIDGVCYPALTNVGVCPTFDTRRVHAETYLLDFAGDLYGKRARIYLLEFLREEKKFNSADELIAQIKNDVERVKKNGRKLD